MTPDQAADARRRKKEELERQLAALEEEDRYYARASQPVDLHRHRDTAAYNAASSSSSYPSRRDMISPPWPRTATSGASSSTGWRTGPVPAASSASGHSQRLPVQPSYQYVLEIPAAGASTSDSQAPWSRSRLPSLASSGAHNTCTSSSNSHSRQPRMPNPFSPTFTNIPVPSKEQVEVYLIRAQGQPLGLKTGWAISNHSFDVYDLLVAVTRLGGSKAVTRRMWWPEMAEILGLPALNAPQGPDMEKTGHQLHTLFTTHLGALEEMWERTAGTAEDAGASYSTSVDSHSRSDLYRIPQAVSSTRGGDDEETGQNFTKTYPPQPPLPRHPVSNPSAGGSPGSKSLASSKQRRPAQTSSVPLHVNSVDTSTRGTTDTQPQRSGGNSYGQLHSQASASEQHYSYLQPQNITGPQSSSISPTLHHPAPSSLAQKRGPSHLDQLLSTNAQDAANAISHAAQTVQTTDSLSGMAHQSSGNAGSSTAPPQTSGSRTTATSFPSLSNYTPPKSASFDHLVQTNALKLPRLPPNVHLDYFGSPSEIFAKRCFELRSVVKKIQAKQPARHISAEEMTFWQKLLAILRHNPQVIIPGHQGDTPMTTDNAPLAPGQAVGHGTNGVPAVPATASSSSQPTANGQAPGEPVKKKRSRPSRASQGDGSDSAPKKRGRPRKNPLSDARVDTSGSMADRSALPDFARSTGLIDAPVATAVPGLSTTDQTVLHPSLAEGEGAAAADSSGSVTVKAKRSFKFRTNPDGTPIPRKPYTIRRHPDGTPVAQRFRKSLLGADSATFSDTQSQSQSVAGDLAATSGTAFAGPSSQPAAQSYHETLDTLLGDVDADGEIDTDTTDLARQVISASGQTTSSQPLPGSSASKVKDPIRSERHRKAALVLWQRLCEERAAQGLPPRGGSLADLRGSPSVPAGTFRSPASQSAVSGTASASASVTKKIPGAATIAANKRWTLFHADGYAGRSDRHSTPAEQAYRQAIRSGSVVPMSASPRRVISLSGGGGGGSSSASAAQTGTPTRKLPADVARERTGSMKPRSSLPLLLTPVPTRYPPPQQSEDDMADEDFEPENEDQDEVNDAEHYEEEEEAPQPRTTRDSAGRVQLGPVVRTRSRPAPRASLPSRLVHTPMSTRSDRGKGKSLAQPRAGSLDDPSPRSILTRNAMSQGSTSRLTRASSSMPNRRLRSGSVTKTTPRSTRARHSVPSSSQGRSRLIPEVELGLSKAVSASSVKHAPRPRSRPQYVVTKIRLVAKPKPAIKPIAKYKSQARPKQIPKRAVLLGPRVVIPISRVSRARLIASGAFDPFYDDDSDEETTIKRHGRAGLRKIALPRGSQARTARPSDPETIPARFTSRNGPELLEPFKAVLDSGTILRRANEHECRWNGCDAQMGSEWQLKRHFELRKHAIQGAFQAGAYGETTLYRCHWVECEKPCFASTADLEQHLSARHISKTLSCPWAKCDLRFSNLSHLSRHALRHHDELGDRPRPLADMSDSGSRPDTLPDQILPESVEAHTLITPLVPPSTYSSVYRRAWCALKVRKGSIAPPNPVLAPDHPQHMLAAAVESEQDADSDTDSVYTVLDGGSMSEERLLDEADGRSKRRLIPVVDVVVRKRAKAGAYQDLFQLGDDLDQPSSVDMQDRAPTGGPDSEQPEGSPRLRARFDLSESVQPETQMDDDKSQGSESEVWAELEDDLANTAVTPAGFPADFDLDQLDDDQPPRPITDPEQDGIDFETIAAETFGAPATPYETYSTPAAFLGFEDSEDVKDAEDEHETVALPTESRDEVIDVEENDEPVWPSDVDIEKELGGMLDATAPSVETSVDAESLSVPAQDTLKEADEGMDVDVAPEAKRPTEPEIALTDDATAEAPPATEGGVIIPTTADDVPTTTGNETNDTVTETIDEEMVAPVIPESQPAISLSQTPTAIENENGIPVSTHSAEPGPPAQPDAEETTAEADATVPDFATLFGQRESSPLVEQSLREDTSDLVNVHNPTAEPEITTTVHGENADTDVDLEVDEDESAIQVETAPPSEVERSVIDEVQASVEGANTDAVTMQTQEMEPEQEQEQEQEQDEPQVPVDSTPEAAEPTPVDYTMADATAVIVTEPSTDTASENILVPILEEDLSPSHHDDQVSPIPTSELTEPNAASVDETETPSIPTDSTLRPDEPVDITTTVVSTSIEETIQETEQEMIPDSVEMANATSPAEATSNIDDLMA